MPDELTQEDDALAIRLGQIADQFTEAVARGERPDVESFARQHPEVASLLRQVLPAIEAMRAAAPPAFAVPQVLGDFRLLREIGRGGMGIVYEAEQLSLPRKVALKLLPVHPALDAKYLARFEREARTAATLHHTNIVPVYAVGHEAGVHYYAMQFIDGPGLDQLLQQWRAGSVSNSPALAVRIGMQVAEALDYAHGRGIVHRDIKPSNILLQLEARSAIRDPQSAIPKITDFGLVKHLDETDNLTRTGDLVGTARYMSPEQTSTKRGPVDGRTDVYSLGVTLYELLTLQPAFDGDHAAVLQQVANVEPIAPRQREPVGAARSGNHRAEGDGEKPGRSLSHGRRAGGRAAPIPGRRADPGATARRPRTRPPLVQAQPDRGRADRRGGAVAIDWQCRLHLLRHPGRGPRRRGDPRARPRRGQ